MSGAHLALVEVADDLLEEILLELLLAPHLGVVPGNEVGGAGPIGPLETNNTAHCYNSPTHAVVSQSILD